MNQVMQRLETLAESMANNEVRALLQPLEAMEPNPQMTERLARLAVPIQEARREYTKLMIAWRKECLVRKVSDEVLNQALKSVSAASTAGEVCEGQ